MPDLEGGMHTVAAPQEPSSCESGSLPGQGEDCLSAVESFDDTVWRNTLNQTDSPSAKDVITLTFAKPDDAQQAKLLLTLRMLRIGRLKAMP